MKVETCELSGTALDWAVAKCENFCLPYLTHSLYDWFKAHGPRYSTDWSQAGPIIERERIATLCPTTGDFWDARDSKTFTKNPQYYRGPTPLIAAMRCLVASKLGDTVDVPEELR